MNASANPETLRQQGRTALLKIARTILIGTVSGFLVTKTQLEPDTLIALGVLMIITPINILTISPVRLAVRIAGITAITVTLRQLVALEHFTEILAISWLILASIATNASIKTQS